MSLIEIEQAKRAARRARERFERTLAEAQDRFRPGSLAEEAWDGVKEKGADLADGAFQAVKKRPAMVSAGLGLLALFLAREPIKRAATRLVAPEDGRAKGSKRAKPSLTNQEAKE